MPSVDILPCGSGPQGDLWLKVHTMFPAYRSINRHLPSLQSGFSGVSSPPFNDTMKVLRLPSPVSSPSVVPRRRYRCTTAWFLRLEWQQIPQSAWTIGHRLARSRSFARRREAIPSSRVNLLRFCPALGPRPECNGLTNCAHTVLLPV